MQNGCLHDRGCHMVFAILCNWRGGGKLKIEEAAGIVVLAMLPPSWNKFEVEKNRESEYREKVWRRIFPKGSLASAILGREQKRPGGGRESVAALGR